MRPQITYPKSLKRALNYHEKKVQKNDAELLHAHNFFKQPGEMNIHDKLNRFNDLLKLNERAETKLIHISLNFHPSEKEKLTKDFYVRLADEYMNRIGFGDQPYLVYQHNDAGHPHIHILSTLIQDDGKRIRTHNMAKDLSEPVRKEMEKIYGFVPADKKEQQMEKSEQLQVSAQRVQAGQSATMRSITNVLDHVINQYKYSTLQELNAILKLYNVRADQGAESGRIYKNRGLTYVVINKAGKAITKPIKASAFHNKPTLKLLEEKFKENGQRRITDKKPVQTAIEWAMRSQPKSLPELATLLKKERIDLVARQNEQGRLYGITYISHSRKVVFNGSDLGKEYAAQRMLERLNAPEQAVTLRKEKALDKKAPASSKEKAVARQQPTGKTQAKQLAVEKESALEKASSKIIDQIIDPFDGSSAINKDLLTDEQRKKKKNFNKQWEL